MHYALNKILKLRFSKATALDAQRYISYHSAALIHITYADIQTHHRHRHIQNTENANEMSFTNYVLPLLCMRCSNIFCSISLLFLIPNLIPTTH